MIWKIGNTKIVVDYFGILLVTVLLILDQSGAMSAALMACVLHEAGHAAALTALGVRLRVIRLCPWGIKMERGSGEIDKRKAIWIAASGPLANLLAAAVTWPISSRFAAVQAVCGVFNLLPLDGMDGGDLLCLILSFRLSDRAIAAVQTAVTAVLGLLLAVAGIGLFLWVGNPTLLLASLYLLFLFVWQKSRSR